MSDSRLLCDVRSRRSKRGRSIVSVNGCWRYSRNVRVSAKGASPEKNYLTRVMVKGSGRVVLLKVDEIDFIEADGNYAKLHVGRKAHLLREKMHDLEGRLDPAKFVRIHRSIIVNLERVVRVEPYSKDSHIAILQDNTRLPVSRAGYTRLRTLLDR